MGIHRSQRAAMRAAAAERAGQRELTVLPSSGTSREMLKEFAELVMQRY